MNDLLKITREAWGWCGIEPAELVAINAFGNAIVQDIAGEIWRICPEELDAAKIASSRLEYETLRSDPDFAALWEMEPLRLNVEAFLREPGEGRCYCLKIPAALGGQYTDDNFGTISVGELLSSSGNLAFQVKEIPDGGKVRLIVQNSN